MIKNPHSPFRKRDHLNSLGLGTGLPHLIVAIDGPAASGKGTLARKLAERFDFSYLDTGALYRAVGLCVLQAGCDPADSEQSAQIACHLAKNFDPSLLSDPELRTDATASAASIVAAQPAVREALRDLQRNFARKPGMSPQGKAYRGSILDGRDIGTVICPDADIKLFITASNESRAQRRTKELQLKGFPVTYEADLTDMRERDARDAERETAPMKPAADAFVLDTTHLTASEVMDQAIAIIRGQLVGMMT